VPLLVELVAPLPVVAAATPNCCSTGGVLGANGVVVAVVVEVVAAAGVLGFGFGAGVLVVEAVAVRLTLAAGGGRKSGRSCGAEAAALVFGAGR
jgi:hypothetical protein